MAGPLASFSTRRTHQSQPATPTQVRNNAGGYAFAVSDTTRVMRFLLLGSETPTYYASAQTLTAQNAAAVIRMAQADHAGLLNLILDVDQANRAPKHDPLLFALAIACATGDADERGQACALIPTLCRTLDHLALLVTYTENQRGWGRAFRRGVAAWYEGQHASSLAYSAAKYHGQRSGWSHSDIIRKAHPKVVDDRALNAVIAWIRGPQTKWAYDQDALPAICEVSDDLRRAATGAQAGDIIRNAEVTLSWEMLPTYLHNDPQVWRELLHDGSVPLRALIRQLGRLTRLGVLDDPIIAQSIASRLSDPVHVTRSRIHPMNALVALKTYASGSGRQGKPFAPHPLILDALDDTYTLAHACATPTHKRHLLALDVSGSMNVPVGTGVMTAREVSSALALTTLRVEGSALTRVVAFTSERGFSAGGASLKPLAISPRQRVDDIVAMTDRLPFGGTDCSLPMVEAKKKGWEVDTFVIYTDSETWAGRIHPFQALREYRAASRIDARLIVVALTSTGFSIADPDDPGMLDVVGFDAALPQLIARFSAREL